MSSNDFTLVLSSPTELAGDFVDSLFNAGCDDGTPSSSNGTVSIDFCRESTDLESAIRSAIANVATAGGVVDHVEIDVDASSLKA